MSGHRVRLPARLVDLIKASDAFRDGSDAHGITIKGEPRLFDLIREATPRSDGSTVITLPLECRSPLHYWTERLAEHAPTENDRRANLRSANTVRKQLRQHLGARL